MALDRNSIFAIEKSLIYLIMSGPPAFSTFLRWYMVPIKLVRITTCLMAKKFTVTKQDKCMYCWH